jgi:hypothetical protein
MKSSIEKAGWTGAAVGGGLGAIAGAAFFLSGPGVDDAKAPLLMPLVTVGGGCVCGFCTSVASIIVACIVQLFRRDKTEVANIGQPRNPAKPDRPAADGLA